MSSNSSGNKHIQGKIYLKNLAKEHNVHFETYVAIMEQYNNFLNVNYELTISKLKGKALLPWQVDLLRRLNPTDYEISTMKEFNEYEAWQKWISDVIKCKQ